MSIFSSKKQTTTLEPMLTDEQKQAMSLLQQFGATGKLGDFQAGQGYDFSGFNFGLNPTELAGGSLLDQNLASGPAAGITDSQNALTGIVNAKFDPTDPSNGFAAFQRQLARATQTSADAIARNAAIGGSRFGTQIGKDYANLGAQQADTTASALADLWKQTQQNKISAASGLNSIANSQENINQSRIQQAFQIGAQQRDVQNQKAQAAYDDWQRARNERMSSINSMTNVMNKNVEYGLKSITTKKPGVGMAMWGEMNPFVGSYNTHEYGYTTNQSSISDLVKAATKMASGGMGGA